jgi:hypothetical protein
VVIGDEAHNLRNQKAAVLAAAGDASAFGGRCGKVFGGRSAGCSAPTACTTGCGTTATAFASAPQQGGCPGGCSTGATGYATQGYASSFYTTQPASGWATGQFAPVYGYSQPYGIPAWGTYGYSMTPNQPATIQTAPAQPGQAVPVPYLLPGQPALPANPATSPTPTATNQNQPSKLRHSLFAPLNSFDLHRVNNRSGADDNTPIGIWFNFVELGFCYRIRKPASVRNPSGIFKNDPAITCGNNAASVDHCYCADQVDCSNLERAKITLKNWLKYFFLYRIRPHILHFVYTHCQWFVHCLSPIGYNPVCSWKGGRL